MSKFHRKKKKNKDQSSDKRLIIILCVAGLLAIAFLASVS